MKQKLKEFQRACGRNALIFIRNFLKIIPLPIFRVLKGCLILIGRPLLAKKKKTALKNLHMAFKGEKPDEEINKIADACFDNFGRGMIDLIYFLDKQDEIHNRVRLLGQENLDKVLEQGKGAIMVGAHFGNFILMYLRMVDAGYKTNVIMKRTRDAAFEKYISEFRDERGIKTIYDLPARQCVQKCIKALRSNEVLFILLDQNYGSDGRVFVDFFGRPAATAAGPVVFSNRTESPILPIFMSSDEGELMNKLEIGSPIELQEGASDEEFIAKNVAKITKVLETKIREMPHEWGGWMHNRWKSREVDTEAIIDKQGPNGQNSKIEAGR